MLSCRNVLYVSQNPSGIETIELLAKEFSSVTFYCVICDNLFNQNILLPSLKNLIPIPIDIPKWRDSFYSLSYISRIFRIRRVYTELENINMPEVDLVLYNNDGAFQRMVGSNFDCLKIMLLDGVLSGNEHRGYGAIIKTVLIKFAFYICPERKNFYLPSILGVSKPDKILVFTNHCRSYLQKNSIDLKKISVIGFPRLNLKKTIMPVESSNKVSKVVFIAQSFVWHGLKEFNDGMLSEIQFWQKVCLEEGFDFLVKAHPRNTESDFGSLGEEILYTSETESYDSRTLFVGMSSTYILECHKLGYGVLITRSSAFFKSVDNMFYSPKFPVAENKMQAVHYLNNLELCLIKSFESDYMFGPDALYEKFESLL